MKNIVLRIIRRLTGAFNTTLDWVSATVAYLVREPSQNDPGVPGLIGFPSAIALTIIFGIPLMIRFLLRKLLDGDRGSLRARYGPNGPGEED